jgi:hypothetical protein
MPIYSDHPIIGTWRLTSFTERNLDTGAIGYPFGETAKALVIYEPNGYVATIFTRSDRQQPLAPQATDQEAMDLYWSMIAFAGRNELSGKRLIYRPEINRSGGERYALAFFCDSHIDWPIAAVPTCVGPNAPPKYPTTYYTDYMARYQQRTYDLLAAENRNAAE